MEKTEIKIPNVGDKLAIYDDGKIRFTRVLFCTVEEVIPFDKASDELKNELKEHSNNSPWLFNFHTPYFIKVKVNNKFREDNENIKYCALTKHNTYFDIDCALMRNDGQLDTDGEATRWLINELPNMNKRTPIDFKEVIKELKEIYNIN